MNNKKEEVQRKTGKVLLLFPFSEPFLLFLFFYYFYIAPKHRRYPGVGYEN